MVLERSRAGVMPAAAEATVSTPATEPLRTSNPAGSVIVALAQLYPRLGDVPANLAAHLSAIAGASANGAGLGVFPEPSLTGYFHKDQVPEVARRV